MIPATHVMVDLETFGSTPGSAIASIGAVAFNLTTGELGGEFYRVIDPASCTDLGLTIDGATVLWWLGQGDSARRALTETRGIHLAVALQEFSAFWAVTGAARFWSHGANFDDPLLAAAYRACKVRTPWRYTESRCTRTIFELANVSPDRGEGTHHNALDDAKAQALAVITAMRAIHSQQPILTAEA